MGVKEQGLDQSRHRYHVVPRTLIFITHEDKVLLLKGAPGKRIWANLYNGIGGHVEKGETVSESARREIAEEVGIHNISNLRLRGIVNIATDDPRIGIMLFIFTAITPDHTVTASSEGMPEWVDWNTLPPEAMAPDLPILLPRVLRMADDDPPFFARYWYDEKDTLQASFS